MPNSHPKDDDLLLKRRARRRLLGAAAFAGFAAVVLPMVMDEEPKQQVQDIQIRIPGQEQTTFTPGISRPDRQITAQIPEDSGDKPVEGGAEKTAAQPVEKPAEQAASHAAARPAEKAPEKATDRPGTQKTAKPEKPKAAEKTAEKPAKTAEKKPEKTPEKVTEKTTEKAGEKPQASATEHAKRTRAEEAQRAAAALAGKDVDAVGKVKEAKAKPAAEHEKAAKNDKQYVIQIGTFSNASNVKHLQDKLGEQGIRVFTESIDSGKKTRVRAGPFASRDAAEKAAEKMKQAGVNGVISGKP